MQWDEIQKQARKAGSLVFAMDQGATAPVKQPGPWGNTQGGYCAGLAIRWIALRYIGTTYDYDPVTLECDMPHWQATREQNIYVDTSGGFPDRYRKALAKYGLTLNKGTVTALTSFSEITPMAECVGAIKGCCMVSLGGHAVAVGREPEYKGSWYFFDANYGEFKFAGANELSTFLKTFFRDSGYGKQFKGYRAIGVNPPPYVASDVKKLVELGWGLD